MSNNCPSLGNYVYNDLFNRIGTWELQVNARLPSEEHLAKSYKVSRPIVREALARLREDGVIHSRRGAGSFIIRIPQPLLNSNEKNMKDWMELLHCYEFRTVLEGNIAYLAAQRATNEDKARIQTAYQRVYENYYSNTSGANPQEESDMDRDMSFHLAIAMATHNRFYVEALQAVMVHIKQSMFLITKVFQGHQERHITILKEEHNWIVNAILSGNPEQAKAAMVMHIQNARDSILPTEKTNEMQGLNVAPISNRGLTPSTDPLK